MITRLFVGFSALAVAAATLTGLSAAPAAAAEPDPLRVLLVLAAGPKENCDALYDDQMNYCYGIPDEQLKQFCRENAWIVYQQCLGNI
ncbi:hypothetical protein ACFWU5_07680 [Nocardia sp. NPDC058640]|uniref:hypothetical protein n=1 Tax=Nocardia sp. NPDC058640 TaxID=3346571 RepID=UPI003664359D